MNSSIAKFDFQEGIEIGNKYRIIKKLGEGWEGEVYIVEEILTGIERAAKFFLPQRNRNNKALKFYAKKLHKLRNCSILIPYLTQETIQVKKNDVAFLVSDFVEGNTLTHFVEKQKSKKLSPFQALHLLHSLARGLEKIHAMKEYHGDLHSDNIIVQRYGLGFDLKLIDMFHWGSAKPENIKDDVCNLIRIFYDVLGGAKTYSKHPKQIKEIICGLKRSLILKKFKTAGQLREYVENINWEG